MITIRKNQLGDSKLYVSELGLGCMSLADDQISNQKVIDTAIDYGINFFDTADLYQFGFNEESVGKALKGRRDEVILASKGGNEWKPGVDGWQWNPSKNYIKAALKNSLLRLGVDYLDLYQLHGGTIDDPLQETIEAFDELTAEGLIRYYGISSIRPNVIQYFAKKSNIITVMMQYSLLDRRPEEMFSFLQSNHISVIARGPVAKGLLTNQYKRKLNQNGYLHYTEAELEQLLPKLQDVASNTGLTLEQLALRYTMDHNTVSTAIAGASDPVQLQENASSTYETRLTSDTIEKLKKLTKPSVYENHRV